MVKDYNIFITPKMVSILTNAGYLYVDNGFDFCVGKKPKENIDPYRVFFYPPNNNDIIENVYCDYEGYESNNTQIFFDNEYLYEVDKVYQLRSKCLKPMRHNVNILSNRIASMYKNDSLMCKGEFSDIMDIHKEWILPDLDFEKNQSIMMKALFMHMDLFEKVDRKIFYLEGEPVGFALYDTSPMYTHLFFVYSIPTVEYLQDYITWMWFRELVKIKDKRLVNYGGSYGDSEIQKYKERLCPYEVRTRYSWEYRPDLQSV